MAMGGSTADGIVAYGFDLGGGYADWKIKEIDEEGNLKLPWLDESDGDEIEALFLDHLVHESGTAPDPDAPNYSALLREAVTVLGIQVVAYGDLDEPSYLLATRSIDTCLSACVALNLAVMQSEVRGGDYNRKLQEACAALGITPLQEQPAWLLVSDFG
jgi:hypothetical protein